MAKKRLTPGEYAAATGLSEGEADNLYRKMREWRRAKTQADLKRGLYLTESAFAAASPDHAPRPYKKDWMTPEQVRAEQQALLGQINQITEGRRKDAEAYRRALLSAATTVYAQKMGASREAAARAGRLLETRYSALLPKHMGVGGGGGYGSGGKDGPKRQLPTESQAQEMTRIGSGMSNLWQGKDTGRIRHVDELGQAGKEQWDDLFNKWGSSQEAGGAEKFGRSSDNFRIWAEATLGRDEKDPEASRYLGTLAAVTHLTGLSEAEMKDRGILIETEGGELEWDEDQLKANTVGARQRHAETLIGIWEEFGSETDSPSGGGGGGGGVMTIPGITDEEYKRIEDLANDSLKQVGVAGGGDFSALLERIVTAAPEELPGLESQLKGTAGTLTPQGGDEPGRTPTGEGTLPPGATPEAFTVEGSPGDGIARGIRNVQDPDAGLDQLWEMYENLDNARTSERDIHLMQQIQSSPQFKAMQQKLGISDPRAAVKAAKMLMRQRRRDERLRDATRLKEIRRDTNRSALMGGLATKKREAIPPTADKGTSGAVVMGGAGGFDGPDAKIREVT